MSAIEAAVAAWDECVAAWLDGRPELSDALERWYRSYSGAVSAEAMPEPWIGSFRRPRLAMLGLNPGQADLDFQGIRGRFADEIRKLGSFSRWAGTDPYGSEAWERRNGVNVYRRARLRFAQRWTQDETVAGRDLLIVELYPWHSKRVTATMKRPADVLDHLRVGTAGRDRSAAHLRVRGAMGKDLRQPQPRARAALGSRRQGVRKRGSVADGGDLSSERAATRVVVCWQQGYAGPPGEQGVERLREIVAAS